MYIFRVKFHLAITSLKISKATMKFQHPKWYLLETSRARCHVARNDLGQGRRANCSDCYQDTCVPVVSIFNELLYSQKST